MEEVDKQGDVAMLQLVGLSQELVQQKGKVSMTVGKTFFASYSHEDGALVEPVVRLLRSTSTPVFFDSDSIEPGSNWRTALNRELSRASTVMVFWSRTAAESDYVKAEWMFASEQQKELIPVLLDSTPLPHELAQYQWIDFRDLMRSPLEREKDGQERRTDIGMCSLPVVLLFLGILLYQRAPDSLRHTTPWLVGAASLLLAISISGSLALARRAVALLRQRRLHCQMAHRLQRRLANAEP